MLNDLTAIKGMGRVVISHLTTTSEISLIRFDDGSTGIRRDGRIIITYETTDAEVCIEMFLQCVNPAKDRPMLAVLLTSLKNHDRAPVQPGVWN